jgi:hypothetical protein
LFADGRHAANYTVSAALVPGVPGAPLYGSQADFDELRSFQRKSAGVTQRLFGCGVWIDIAMTKPTSRLIEAGGMLLVLLAWGLNWVSVERWTEARLVLERDVERIVQTNQNVQVSANVMLEFAINRINRAERSRGVVRLRD